MIDNDRRNEDKPEAASEETPTEPPAATDAPSAVEPDAEPLAVEEPVDDAATYEELKAELDETKDRLVRTLAEIENLRRRHARELEDARKYAVSGFARELVDVADNLNRALASVPPKAREKIDLIKNLVEGVAMTERALLGSFERHQIVKVAPEKGDKFDHNRHQAMFEVETDDQPPGTIAQVVQPGYTIADRLLRPAMVGVAKPILRPDDGPGEEGAEEAAPDETAEVVELRPGERIDTTA
jgi:molecular chaperone GrpE